MSQANKELSRRFTDLFGIADLASAEEILSSDVVAAYRRAFPDARSSVEDQIAEGDKVVTRWRLATTAGRRARGRGGGGIGGEG